MICPGDGTAVLKKEKVETTGDAGFLLSFVNTAARSAADLRDVLVRWLLHTVCADRSTRDSSDTSSILLRVLPRPFVVVFFYELSCVFF